MNKDEFQKSAKLAGLSINGDEVERYRSEFEKILSHIDKIRNIDIDDSPEKNSPLLKRQEMRPDIAGNSIASDDVLRNSKSADSQFFISQNRK